MNKIRTSGRSMQGRWLLVLALAAGPVAAEPGFARLYKAQFGYAPSCNACHKDGGGTPLNGYGQQFKEAGMNAAAWAQTARLDGDGDGIGNEEEARARANPGSRHSTPASTGDWLALANLIPREVQEAFPGIREYLPRDALLTESDVVRARALGATLAARDENTIYIPLRDKKPVGTAIIFPVAYQGKTLFLLLTTDRVLNVTGVQPLNPRTLPQAQQRPIYEQFKGVAVDRLPAATGEGLDAAIAAAVKNAGTLLYVRLKNA